MRIGIDGRQLLGWRTGVGRYLEALLDEWTSAGGPDHEWIVYTPPYPTEPLVGRRPVAELRTVRHRVVGTRYGVWWEQRDLAEAVSGDRLDLFFAPAYAAPLGLRVPWVVTMHDVSFMAHPEWFRWREGWRRRVLAARSMARARAVIAVSEFTRREILRHSNVPYERLHVVRSGILAPQPPFGPAEPEHLVLYVGTIFNRRHLPTLLTAFTRVARTLLQARLMLIGEDRSHPAIDLAGRIAATGLAHRIDWLPYVSESDLAALYGRARVFVFLSEYEGFGFTPLEALAAGVPCVVADTPVAREIYGDAAVRVPVRDAAATAQALASLLVDEEARARCRARAAEILPRFIWARAARATLDVFARAVRDDG